jgi:hypothetical protein
MKTFDEMLELISHSLDEVTLLEVLEINSEDIVVAFSDRIRINYISLTGWKRK